ncbi:hypothetical protein HEK616_35680 [Streptomyces nigrescens]|uniref:Uncharacterized protein n=1 Tax=Streptomyces nigrescens TaxID=1920 RepID=A0ABM7ZUU8_STRNI|nr:hypothetical protein HEK616_35680 [Streptomyces nigrescens]
MHGSTSDHTIRNGVLARFRPPGAGLDTHRARGPEASFTVEESVPLLVDFLLSELGTPVLAYLDRSGQTVPW